MKTWLELLEIARENVRKKQQLEKVSDYRLSCEMKISRQGMSQLLKGIDTAGAVTKLKIALLSEQELKPLAERIVLEDDAKKKS